MTSQGLCLDLESLVVEEQVQRLGWASSGALVRLSPEGLPPWVRGCPEARRVDMLSHPDCLAGL